MEEHLDSCFLTHLIKNELQGLCIKWSKMVMSRLDPCRIRCATTHFARMYRTADLNKAINDFAKVLESRGIRATVRRRLGADINASCGQLRRETLQAKEEQAPVSE